MNENKHEWTPEEIEKYISEETFGGRLEELSRQVENLKGIYREKFGPVLWPVIWKLARFIAWVRRIRW